MRDLVVVAHAMSPVMVYPDKDTSITRHTTRILNYTSSFRVNELTANIFFLSGSLSPLHASSAFAIGAEDPTYLKVPSDNIIAGVMSTLCALGMINIGSGLYSMSYGVNKV